jgi:protein tyrosine/serine phosphatase
MLNNVLLLNAWRLCFRAFKASALALLLVAALIASYCGVIRYTGNIHVVEQGKFYRSAQLDDKQLRQIIAKYKIKSILNLLGQHSTEPWYEDELTISKTLYLEHYDYGISAGDLVTLEQINEILDIVRTAQKPMLVHCLSGADRTGLVAALFLADVEKRSIYEAADQLSLKYGHFPYLTSDTGAMDETYWAYVRASAAHREDASTAFHPPNR